MLELEHASVSDVFVSYPESGMWGVGTGWEMELLALNAYLCGELPDATAAEFEETPEVQDLADRSGQAWAALVRAADAETAASAGRGPPAAEETEPTPTVADL